MPGTFVLSLDTELAWGTVDKEGAHKYRRHFAKTRVGIKRLLELLQRYDVAATWAIVGHLFLEKCERQTGAEDPHPDVATGRRLGDGRHWHATDPATNRESAPFWYGDDIVEMIRTSTPAQEIGCHTFSHVPFDDPAVDDQVVRSQLDKCTAVAADAGIELRSFVFPRNRIGHVDSLGHHGFTAYRGLQQGWYTSLPGRASRLASAGHRVFGLTPPVYRIEELDASLGVVNVPASMYLMPRDGVRRLIPAGARLRQAKRGLTAAARREAMFHLWFHPWNVGGSPELIDWLEQILQTMSALRSEGQIDSMTMEEVAAVRLGDYGRDLHTR